MPVRFHALPTRDVTATRRTEREAYGNPVERRTATKEVWPCRHCLGSIAPGDDYLVLAYRPFDSTNPYAETGPIFLCAKDCSQAKPASQVPPILRATGYIVRGYDAAERIVYGTGQVTPTPDIADYAARLLERDEIAFVDVRSAANNCYQCRVTRSSARIPFGQS